MEDSEFVRKIEISKDESQLFVLDSDFLTFNIYDVKRQRRTCTWKYENPERKSIIFNFKSLNQRSSLLPSQKTQILYS